MTFARSAGSAVQRTTLAVLTSLAAEQLPAQTGGLDWEAIAQTVVARMDLDTGENVLFVARPGPFDPLIPSLRHAVRAAGATDLGVIATTPGAPGEWATEFTEGAGGKTGGDLVRYFATVDLGVMLPGATPDDPAYAAMQQVLRRGTSRTIHFHWAGAFDLGGNELPITDSVSAMYQRALLETDYAALAERQRRFERAMRGRTVRVRTPLGTDITFEIGDRPVTKQDGDASARRAAQARNLIDREIELPAGAVRVAPIEQTVNGRIAFPPSTWHGTRVAGLVLTLREGRVVSFDAASGRDAVAAELARAGEAARGFREFALGFNPLLAIPDRAPRWIPYYGYGAGVVRLSLGDNTELGGAVRGGYVRWNFFTDATVTLGDEVWVRNGQLIER